MKRSNGVMKSALVGAVALSALAAVSLSDTPAEAQYAPPPPVVIATLTPVYHEGHSTYWYNGYWHYRDPRGAWTYYHSEPAFLRDHRMHHPAQYHHYGRRR